MSTHASTVDEVAEFYDDVAGLVEIFGGSLHNGYWVDDHDRTPFLEATNRLSDLVGGKLELRPGQRVLDIGCGVGVPAIRLAQRTDAEIVGITVSAWQVQEATRRANAAGLRGQVTFAFGDAATLDFPDESFDGVLAFDSLPHAADRGVWLREMARVLRPGGRLVVTDFTAEVALTDQDTEVMRFGQMAPPLATPAFVDLVRANGFTVDEFVNCGDHVRRTYTAYFEQIARRKDELSAAYGAEKVTMYEQGMVPLFAICKEKLGYVIVAGRKPA